MTPQLRVSRGCSQDVLQAVTSFMAPLGTVIDRIHFLVGLRISYLVAVGQRPPSAAK